MGIDSTKYHQLTKNIGIIGSNANVGVLNTSAGIFLIDAGGTEKAGNEIIDLIEELFPGKIIAGVFLTHAHTDHAGGVPAIVERTSASVYAAKTTSCFLEIPESTVMIYAGGKPCKEMYTEEFLMSRPVKTDVVLAENQELNLGGIAVKTIDLPGHCPGMTGFLVKDLEDKKKVFFLGDAFFGMKMLKKIWIPFILDPAEFRNSIYKIEQTSSDWFIPAHGECCTMETAGCVAEHNIITTYEFEDLILKLIGSDCNEMSRILEATANYAGMKLKASNYYLIMTTLRSYIASLEEEGAIESYMENNKLLWRLK